MKWSDAEVEALRVAYGVAKPAKAIDLPGLAIRLGRNKANVCRKARALGLTNQQRPMISADQRKPTRKFDCPIERSAHLSAVGKTKWSRFPHPRGALGMKHSEETKILLAAQSRAKWSDPEGPMRTDAFKQRMSDAMHKRRVAGDLSGSGGYSRTKGGKRADLGDRYFRSSWEANYARYLTFLVSRGEIVSWEYECRTFLFETIKRGTRSYTPDFKVVELSGAHVWHEVKGWMDAASKTRLARMAKFYPDERVIVVDKPWFAQANKTMGRMLPHWESPSRAAPLKAP